MNVTKDEVRKIMQEIPLISTDGCSKGFFNILPLGNWSNLCINYLTNIVRDAVKPHNISFPIVFTSNSSQITELIKKFNDVDEVFHLRDDSLALSYSPDPNLFLWLKDKKLHSSKLPYALETTSFFMRKTKSGALNGLDRVRQFSFPVVFILSKEINAEENVLNFLKHASLVMNLIFGKDWKTKITTNEFFYEANKSHFDNIAKTTGSKVEYLIHQQQTRYFAYKLGLYAYAEYDDLMVFNLQWDNTNPNLFNITINDNADPLVIIHTTLAGAINRVYPSLIGNGLKYGLKVFPPVIAPYQVGIIFDENSKNKVLINEIKNIFSTKYFRNYIPGKELNFKNKIAKIDQLWIPYLIIVSNEASTLDELRIYDRMQANKPQISFFELECLLSSLPTTNNYLYHDKSNLALPF